MPGKILKYVILIFLLISAGYGVYEFEFKYHASDSALPDDSTLPDLYDMNSMKLDSSIKADRVIVFKGRREMMLLKDGDTLKTYRISLGGNPSGHKEMEGDSKTPEGRYILDWRNPNSKYHLSLHVSYPNEQDIKNAKEMGVSPGGDIMVHGCPNGLGWNWQYYKANDWTDGCIAVSDEEIEEIWSAVENGTEIEIFP